MSIFAGSLKISEAVVSTLGFIDEYDWQSDYDKEVRECNVSLWTRSIEGWNTTEDITNQHQALVFEWVESPDDRTATYEAKDTNGYLLPRWFDGKPKGKLWDKTIVKNIGTYLISPQKVNNSAKNCQLNGKKYVHDDVNSQKWVAILANDLEIELNEITLTESDPISVASATNVATMDNNEPDDTALAEYELVPVAAAKTVDTIDDSELKKMTLTETDLIAVAADTTDTSTVDRNKVPILRTRYAKFLK